MYKRCRGGQSLATICSTDLSRKAEAMTECKQASVLSQLIAKGLVLAVLTAMIALAGNPVVSAKLMRVKGGITAVFGR